MQDIHTMEKKNIVRGAKKGSQESITKLEFARKRNSQATRNKELDKNDKTPASRGRTGQRCTRSREKGNSQVNSQNWEAGSVHKSGSKRQRDITHQILYQEYQRNYNNRYVHHGQRYERRSHFHEGFSKEKYLQARCQFVVISGNDYSIYKNNVDKIVEWALVEEVLFHCVEPPNCPICLYPPVAAKITKCGHIFCYSCILHYLALSDSKCRKCPLCTETVQKDNIKSIITIQYKDYNIGDKIEMTLMKRNRDSLVPVPVYPSMIPSTNPYSNLENGLNNLKLIIFDDEEVCKYIINRELSELKLQKESEGDQPEACFIDEALNLLEARKDKLFEDQLTTLSLCEGATALPPAVHTDWAQGCIQSEPKSPPENRNGQKLTTYFYQAKTGSHVFLHSVNIEMITSEFSGLENCPETITGIIIDKESVSMSSKFRERFRYLKHLPLTCLFDLVELHITEPIISARVVLEFKEKVDNREKERKRREKEVKKIDQRVQHEEDEMFGRSKKVVNVYPDSRTQFPDFSEEPSIVSDELICSEVTGKEPSNNAKWNVGSFAQMTKKKAVPDISWPSLPSRSISALSNEGDEASYNVPDYSASFLRATNGCTTNTISSQKEKGQGKKKKKNILFSTGGQKI